ncbi:MAG: neutral/alkaline non-lysosomal ceramidase N-terminal domain-containing protein [Acidobacteria bacterium]|nr:neutral/alkaline non-lysosomal ceramidase N-terminal domain-containing protein [Acidobacteriota bacterium]
MKAILSLLLLAGALGAADFRAGVGRIDITPDGPIWMSGYAARTKPSEGVLVRLGAKALALEDNKKNRVVIVTTDIIGLPRSISDSVAARVQKEHGLDRAAVLFNSSHTHTGPVVRPNLISMYSLSEEQDRVLQRYAQQLTEKLGTVIGAALGDLKPARLSYGAGQAGFAINRRQETPKGVVIGTNPKGPVDYEVPVLKVEGADGALRAVLFAYTCHNTTLGADIYQLTGDYAGYAQEAVEKAHPGATAMFMIQCGADQNPYPRGTLELAQKHGQTLAAAVSGVLAKRLAPVQGPLRSAFRMVDLRFAPHSREQFEKEAADTNRYKVARAKAMLAAYDERHPVRSTPYPIQAIRFGKGLTLVALGGEVVVDYQLRIKSEFGASQMVVAGYSNDVMCYIPSQRVLKEGGYEAVDSMTYYGQPGPFAGDVEETVIDGVRAVLKKVGRAPVKR